MLGAGVPIPGPPMGGGGPAAGTTVGGDAVALSSEVAPRFGWLNVSLGVPPAEAGVAAAVVVEVVVVDVDGELRGRLEVTSLLTVVLRLVLVSSSASAADDEGM